MLQPTIPLQRTIDTRERAMDWLERFAWLMDEQWRVPGTKIRLGLDGLIGILPVGGDIATGVAQACFVLVAQHTFNLPKRVVHRMAANVAVDLVVGAIPLLGDLFDIHFKANKRNLALIKEHLQGYPDV